MDRPQYRRQRLLYGIRAFSAKIAGLDIFLAVVPKPAGVGHEERQKYSGDDITCQIAADGENAATRPTIIVTMITTLPPATVLLTPSVAISIFIGFRHDAFLAFFETRISSN